MEKAMLRKIDCVMIQVEDLEVASEYNSNVFGLRRLWQDETSVGLGFPETDAEAVLHCNIATWRFHHESMFTTSLMT